LARLDGALAEILRPEAVRETFAEIGLFRYEQVRLIARQPGAWFILRPALLQETRASLTTTLRALEAAKLPWPARIGAIERLEVERPTLRLSGRSWFWNAGSWFRRVVRGMAETEGYIRAARAVVAIEIHRREHDRVPQSLAELGDRPDLVDPFTGQPLRYVSAADGYTVYGTGQDGRDDGGALDPAPQKGVPITEVSPKDVGVRVTYRRAASTSPSNSGLNSPVR
jgi:hypothetical protein